jgi:glycosyltransferase involved in cell wall biosynthesis
MYLQNQHTALYAAFDIFPSSKGAATHINYFAETLFSIKNDGWLHVLGDSEMPSYQIEDNNIEITRFTEQIPNFLQRTNTYGEQLYDALLSQKNLEICHFRDIWSGLPIISYQNSQNNSQDTSQNIANQKPIKTVFEVNSLPSIELPYRYKLSATTLQNIKSLEQICLNEADKIIVPSEILRNFLIQKGIKNNKISLIYNGAIIPEISKIAENLRNIEHIEKFSIMPEEYIIYFGALQSWQGIEILLRAFALLRDKENLYLVICSSLKEKFSRNFHKLAEKLGINDKIIWKYQLSKLDLQTWILSAKLSVAPLTECSRNLEQGCCPLKILESMACAVPVVASDLPVTQELIKQHENGKLVRADRPAELSRAIRLLLDEPEFCRELGQNARKTIVDKFTWVDKQNELREVYSTLV